MIIKLWDIDGVLADSRHRTAYKADGSLNLAHWCDNNTPEQIKADKPILHNIQLLKSMLSFSKAIFITARVISEHDKAWLSEHIGNFPIYSRQKGDKRPDYELKLDLFHQIKQDYPQAISFMLFDDNKANCDTLEKQGVYPVYLGD